ncbi:MAG: hypothetical protein ABI559_01765 [Chloroflexota bacterium]
MGFLKRRGFEAGYGVMVFGLAVMLVGFGVDAYLHSKDSTLAESEGIFTLSNPGHLMVAIGVIVAVLGACLGPYTRWVLGRRSTMLTVAVPVAAVVIAASVSGMFATALNDLSHHAAAHNDTATSHSASTATDATHAATHSANILAANVATVNVEDSTMHEPANGQGVTADNLNFAETFLTQAREGTAKYQDVAVAKADGYIRITPDLPLIGAHFFKPGLDGLDPAHPSILLYQKGLNSKWELAGLAYTMPKAVGDDTPPVTQLGGLAHWHYHADLCFTSGGNVTITVSAKQCAGVFQEETSWLLHVWVWKESPEGVFAHMNSLMQ